MEERENRFIIDNIYDEDIINITPNDKVEEKKENSNTLESFEKVLSDEKIDTGSDNFINSFKMELPEENEPVSETASDKVEKVADDNLVVDTPSFNNVEKTVSDNLTIDIPTLEDTSNKQVDSDEVEETLEDTPVIINDEEEKENEPLVYDATEDKNDESLSPEEAFESGRNLQDMINKILKIDNLEPVKVEIAGVNDKGYEEQKRIREELETKRREQNMFQDEIAEIMKKDTTEVVFKSNLLETLKQKSNENNQISMLARYGEDYCSKDFVTNPAIGRDNEIKQLILTLLTPEKSAILVGKAGIGKTSIVEGLAYRLERNLVPSALRGYTIVNIKTPSLLGTLPTGETRLQTLVDELKTLDKVILFIDEIHMLIGATNDSSLDFANMFKEGLGRGQIKIIGATTTEEYERYILRDKAFVRRFQTIEVLEPSREHTIKILMGTLPKIEKETGAKMKYTSFIQSEIMAFIVDITSEYKRVYGIGSRYPDICLNLLKEAFSQCIFNNRNEVTIFDVKNAILNSKNIYPDVIKKEIVNFDAKFKKIMDEENI